MMTLVAILGTAMLTFAVFGGLAIWLSWRAER